MCVVKLRKVMGIRGLRGFLRSKVRIPACNALVGSTLVIDGDGWINYLVQINRVALRCDLGCIYEALAAAVRTEIQNLQSFGFQLIVLFGAGVQNPLQEKAINARLYQREFEWDALHTYCVTAVSPKTKNECPRPPLCKEQLVAVLKSVNIQYQF